MIFDENDLPKKLFIPTYICIVTVLRIDARIIYLVFD